jgi:Flp pilus assembly protein TadG
VSVRRDDGSTIPLILGFFLIAVFVVAGSVSLGQVFVQQRDLQDVCDGAAAAAAASAADLDRSGAVAAAESLQFTYVHTVVGDYLARDPGRRGVQVSTMLSADRRRITLTCAQTRALAFGGLLGRARIRHVATSTALAAVLG